MSNGISIVIVTYNSENYIFDCLVALKDASVPFEVIIIDNASLDSSIDIARAAMPQATIVANTDNVGFAKAVNAGVKLAAHDYFMLLNPDCRLLGAGLDELVRTLDVDRGVGIVAPAIEHPNGRLEVRSAGFQPKLPAMLVHSAGLARFPLTARHVRGFHLYPAGESGTDTEVEWVSGACFAVRRSTWENVGGLSEKWFMYAEDIQLCNRVRLAGESILHTSRAKATHVVGASSETVDGPVWTLWIENLADYYKTEFRPKPVTMLLWKAATSSIYFSRAAVYTLRSLIDQPHRGQWRRESTKFIAYAQAVMRFG